MSTFIGIEIGGTKLQMARGSSEVDEIFREGIEPEGGADTIRKQIERGLRQLMQAKNIAAIGVGFGGPVNRDTGVIEQSHQVLGWEGFPIKEWLHQLSGLPVVIDNDANVAALGEALQGAGRGFQRVFYMTLGSGIGGGMVIDGNIYHGRHPGELEAGHLRMDKSGATLESKCSGWAVNQKVRACISQNPSGILALLAGANTSHEARWLKPALEQGDSHALQIMEETADDIAFALSHVLHLFNPDVVILGGGLSHLQHYLLHPVQISLAKYLMKALQPPPPLFTAQLGEMVVRVVIVNRLIGLLCN